MSVQLYLGDCLEVMKGLPDGCADGIVMDPPFAFAGGISNGRASMADNQFFLHWWRDVCRQLDRVGKKTGEGFCWCDWRTGASIAEGFNLGQKYAWRVSQMLYHYREMPGQGQPFRNSVDMIAYLRGPKSDGHRIPNTTHNWLSKYWYYGKHENHPAEKDVEIAKQLILWCSDPGDTIMDPFAGSGTVGLACLQTGRNFIGIEIEERFLRVAERRIAEAQQQPALLEVG